MSDYHNGKTEATKKIKKLIKKLDLWEVKEVWNYCGKIHNDLLKERA